jgi:thiamine kinase-like enzyme
VPVGDDPITEELHATLIDHLAALSARFWNWRDGLGLLPLGRRWEFFSPHMVAGERALGFPEHVPRLVEQGWRQFAARAPGDVASAVASLRADATPLVEALAGTPTTFLHGDWKLGNLGHAPDGRTVLLDWAYVGEGHACHELAWYLALNRARLPIGHTKESTIDEFRAALERHGVATDPWWERQLGVCLLGALVQFGWEKALGDGDELHWWCDRARAGLELL